MIITEEREVLASHPTLGMSGFCRGLKVDPIDREKLTISRQARKVALWIDSLQLGAVRTPGVYANDLRHHADHALGYVSMGEIILAAYMLGLTVSRRGQVKIGIKAALFEAFSSRPKGERVFRRWAVDEVRIDLAASGGCSMQLAEAETERRNARLGSPVGPMPKAWFRL